MQIEIAQSRGDKHPLKVEFDFGETIHEAASKFDTDGPYGKVVMHLFVQAAKQQLRAAVLEWLSNEVAQGRMPTSAQVQAFVTDWKPEIKHHGRRPLDKAAEAIKGLNAEELAMLRQQLG